MNRRIATAMAVAGSLLLGPAALAADNPDPATGHDVESVVDGPLDHGEGEKGDKDDHDHDGDGKPDHDPEDHDKDEESDDDDE